MNCLCWKRQIALLLKPIVLLIAIAVVFSLVGCAQSATPQPTPTATKAPSPTQLPSPSPTPVPGTVLYAANWSHGLGNWHVSQGWSVVQGQLQVNSVPETTITVPYMPAISNYAIELRVQVVKVLKQADNHFFLVEQQNSHSDGFDAGFQSLYSYQPSEQPGPGFYTGFIQAIAKNLNVNAGVQQIDYVPGKLMRTYRVEVSGNQVTLFVDGSRVSGSTSLESAFSNGPILLDSSGLLLRIGGFRITAL